MTTYISCRMTGVPDLNRPAFAAAAARLRAQGATVINPHDLPAPCCASGNCDWSAHMRVDLAALLTCDSILMLPGWQDSRGACIERMIAEVIGLTVVYEEEELPKPIMW